MPQRPEPIPADRTEPIRRDAEDVLRFFAPPGMRTYVAADHPEDSVPFLALT